MITLLNSTRKLLIKKAEPDKSSLNVKKDYLLYHESALQLQLLSQYEINGSLKIPVAGEHFHILCIVLTLRKV